MKCSFSRLLYPKRLEEARDGSYMIALFKPNEKLLDAQGNRLSSIKVVGHFLPTVASVKVDMTGHWKKDARYGLQFEMESYEEIVGSDKRSIVAYLSSGMIPGIGSVLAERIYNTFGAQTLEVLDQNPARIAEVPGISKKKCEKFCSAYMETRSARKLINMLAPFNISAPQAIKLREQLGDTLHVTVGQDGCLSVYSDAEWEKFQQKLDERNFTDVKKLRLMFAYMADCEPDAQGRILIPNHLRQRAKLEKEVVVAGIFNRVEIWNAQRWAELEEEAFSSGSLEQAMEEMGL